MPKVRRSKKSPPEGWELIEPTLEELEQKMREGNAQFITSERSWIQFHCCEIWRFWILTAQ